MTVEQNETILSPGAGGASTQQSKRSTFDALGRLVSTTDAAGTADAVTTTYGYDVQGNLASVHVNGTQVADISYDTSSTLDSHKQQHLEQHLGQPQGTRASTLGSQRTR